MKWTISTALTSTFLLAVFALTLGLPVETKANPNSSACSSRYQVAWEMPLRSGDVGRNLRDVLQRSEFSTARINAIRRTSIARGPGGRVALQMDIPQGQNSASTFFLAPLGAPGVEAACLSLMVYLENGFEWPRSGAGTKMGWGLWGGDDASGVSGGTYPSQQTGFSVRNVNNDWGFRLYSYHLNRPGRFGQQGSPVARFNTSDWGTGRWHKIEMEIVLNDPGQSNGYAQLWLDGKNRQTMTNLRFRNNSNWAIRGLMFNDMWGGNTSNPDQFSPKAQKMWYADYTLYTSRGGAVARAPSSSTSTAQSSSSEPAPTQSSSSGGSGFGAISPSGPTNRSNVVLRWRPYAGAERYYLRINDRNGSMIVGTTVWPNRACSSSECTHQISSLPAGQLEWMVRPQNGSRHLAGYSALSIDTSSGGAVTQTSSTSPSTTQSSSSEPAPTQSSSSGGSGFGAISPSGPTNRSNVVLRWRPYAGAERYYLRINDRNGSMIVGTTVWPSGSCSSSECTHQISSLPAGQLEWMVRPQNGSRHLAGYSALSIDTSSGGAVTQTSSTSPSSEPSTTQSSSSGGSGFGAISPSGSTNRSNVVLRWRPYAGAERYYLRVNDRNGSMIVGTTVWPSGSCSSSECTHQIRSLPAGQLEWMVRPQNGSRHLAGYSALSIDTR